MTTSRAVVLIDHHSARIQQFDSEGSHVTQVKDHVHDTRQHRSAGRAEKEFFAAVSDDLAGITEILITGSRLGQAAFRDFIDAHRPALRKQIAGWETVDHPSEGELLALARKFFLGHDRLVGTRPIREE
jgi:stalled ribosome rescue protein Dom34